MMQRYVDLDQALNFELDITDDDLILLLETARYIFKQ